MRKKLFLAVVVTLIMSMSWGMTVFAQPKTMPDGTTFDAEYYANTYPDVKAALGTDEATLYNHYCKHGKSEGRQPVANAVTTSKTSLPDKSVFDPEYYANTYPDVKAAFGSDANALYQHYVKYGKAEGRQAVQSQKTAQKQGVLSADLVTELPTFSAETAAKYSKRVPVSIGKNDDKYFMYRSEEDSKRLAVCRADCSNDPIYIAARNYILQEWDRSKNSTWSIQLPIAFVFSSEESFKELYDLMLNLSVDMAKANVAPKVRVACSPTDGMLHTGRLKVWEDGRSYSISCSITTDTW